jgi:hypothetical protein
MTDVLEDRLRQMLQSVAATTAIPDVPAVSDAAGVPGRRRRWRRAGIAAIAVAGLSAAGLSAAAAGGAFSHDAAVAYADWENIDPATATKIADIPVPGHQRLEVFIAPESGSSFSCIADLLVKKHSPVDNPDGGVCDNFKTSGSARNGMSGSPPPPPGKTQAPFWYFTLPAGPATASAVSYYGGKVHSLAVKDGWATGWVPTRYASDVTITGYDSQGHVTYQLTGPIGS